MATAAGITAFPLAWPVGRARAAVRSRPQFKSGTFAQARDGLLAELRRLGATGVVLSTNVQLRQDGLPYANQRQPDDTGVAVYFARKGRSLCLTCDRWVKVEDNLDALRRWVEAQRGQERWVGSDFVDAVFSGFAALPPAAGTVPTANRTWWEVFGVVRQAERVQVEAIYRKMALDRHPDRGGTAEGMAEVNAAFDEFNKERGG